MGTLKFRIQILTTRYIAVAFAIFCASAVIIAQKSQTSIPDISKMSNASAAIVRSMPHRSITTVKVYEDGGTNPSIVTKSTREVIPNDRTRIIIERETSTSSSRTEYISVGKKSYKRESYEPWQIVTPTKSNEKEHLLHEPRHPDIPFEKTVRLIDTFSIDSGIVNVYQVRRIYKVDFVGKELLTTQTDRFWFRGDGILLMSESIRKSVGGKQTKSNDIKSVTSYEFEDIKIEEPEVIQ